MSAFTAFQTVQVPGSSGSQCSGITRDRLVCHAERRRTDQDTIVNRRDGVILTLGLFGLLGAGTAEARSDPYYDELLSKTKGLDSSDLLSKYQTSKSADGKKARSQPKKRNLNINADALNRERGKAMVNKRSAVTRAGPLSSSSGSNSGISTLEVGLGLTTLAGVVAVGQSSSKGKKANKATQDTQNRAMLTQKKSLQSKPSQKVSKAASGTVRLSPGTKRVKSKTNKVGTVQRVKERKTNTQETKSPLAALLIGLVALIGAGSILGSQPEIKEAEPAKPLPVQEKPSEKSDNLTPSTPAQVVVSEIPSTTQDAKPSQKPSTKEVKNSKLPPTTGNSPLVIIGGSLLTLVAAAAVGGGSEKNTKVNAPESSLPTDDAVVRAKEAKEWIAAWKARQK